MKCYACKKVKACKMYVRNPANDGWSKAGTKTVYLCKPCLRGGA